MSPAQRRRRPYDALFKLLRQHPRAVLPLIRGVLRPRLNFPLPEAQWQAMDKEWITPDLEHRVSDKIWLLRGPAEQPRIALRLVGLQNHPGGFARGRGRQWL